MFYSNLIQKRNKWQLHYPQSTVQFMFHWIHEFYSSIVMYDVVVFVSLSRFRLGLRGSESYWRELVHFRFLLLLVCLCRASPVHHRGRRGRCRCWCWGPLHLFLRRLLNPLKTEPGVYAALATVLPILLKLLKSWWALKQGSLRELKEP